MELGLSTYSIAPHVKCDLARPWVRGALKKNLIFFNAPAKSSRSGRAKFLMNFIENH